MRDWKSAPSCRCAASPRPRAARSSAICSRRSTWPAPTMPTLPALRELALQQGAPLDGASGVEAELQAICDARAGRPAHRTARQPVRCRREFAQIGGHTRAGRAALAGTVDVTDIFDHPSIAELARLIESRREGSKTYMVEQDSLEGRAGRARCCWRCGAAPPRISALPAALAPQDPGRGAYAIQLALLQRNGHRTSPAGRPACSRATMAPARRSRPMRWSMRPPTRRCCGRRLPDPAPYGIEAEVAFRLGRDLPPLRAGARYEREAVCAAIVSAHAVIEVVASRFVDPDAVSKLELIADQLINSLLVVGPSCPNWQSLAVGRAAARSARAGPSGLPGPRRPSAGRSADSAGVARQSPLAVRPRPARRRTRHHRQLLRSAVRGARSRRATAHFAGLGSAVVTF